MPDLVAITHISADDQQTSLTFRQLHERAEQVAETLEQLGPAGNRALLLYPPGTEFLVAFCGSLIAGWTPVPTCFPRRGRNMSRLDSIASSCQPAALLADRETLASAATERWHPQAASLPRLATDDLSASLSAAQRGRLATAGTESTPPLSPGLALLQFTSGSTSQPKGVMVGHEQLMANLEAIRLGFGLDFHDPRQTTNANVVFWLPAFHDMGLIGGLLTPLYLGLHTINLAPQDFLTRPLRWLSTISRYRAEVTGAPNFAYQLCIDRIQEADAEQLDLSSLQVAFCGAEPIQPRTLEMFANRFAHTGMAATSLMPCYGLAEATLYVAGLRHRSDSKSPAAMLTLDRNALLRGRAEEADATAPPATTRRCIASGFAAVETELRIVDPETCQPLSDNLVGEIWIRGSSVAHGYWPPQSTDAGERDAASSEGYSSQIFNARLANQPDDSAAYCRTGDLGFIRNGLLFVTGRRKDLIILRGRNHYPQDIEQTVQRTLPSAVGTIAAFAADGLTGEGLAVVVEVNRDVKQHRFPQLIQEIRGAIIDQHEIDPRHVVLVRLASIPRTTSGKVQRNECRRQMERDELNVRHRWDRAEMRVDGAPQAIPLVPANPSAADHATLSQTIEQWLLTWLSSRTGGSLEQLDPTRPLDDFGLDSFSAFELSGELEDWLGLRLTPDMAFQHPTPRQLSRYLAEQLIAEP
ncbi:AMP-binding protein [Planctomycetaceae bacterium SH139]